MICVLKRSVILPSHIFLKLARSAGEREVGGRARKRGRGFTHCAVSAAK